MLGAGSTVKELRELIAVPARTERVLWAYAQAHPKEAPGVERILMFRQAVGREFERLVRAGIPVADLPEVGEPERDTVGGVFANAQG